MSKKIFILCGLLLPFLGFSQNWVNTIGSKKYENGNCLEIDGKKNLYMAGTYEDTIDVDNSSAVVKLLTKGSNDIYIMKTTENGDFLWAKNFGSKGSDDYPELEVDLYGNSYLSFQYRDTIKIRVLAKDTQFTCLPGKWASLLLKLNSAGTVLWARRLGNNGVVSNGLRLGPDRNLWLSGRYAQETIDADFGPGVFQVGDLNKAGYFVARYDTSDMSLIGACDIQGITSVSQMAVSKASGKVVLACNLSSLNSIPLLTKDTTVSLTQETPCLIEIDPLSMKVKKVLPYRVTSSSYSFTKMDFDGQDNLIIVGYWGYSEFDAGLLPGESVLRPAFRYEDILYVKYTSDYHVVWCHRFNGPTQSYGYALSVEDGGDFYVSSNIGYNNPIDIDPSSGITMVNGGSIIAKFDANAKLIWHGVMVAQSTVVVRDIETSNGRVFGTGLYQTPARLHPDQPSLITPFKGVFDAFYFSYFPPVITGIEMLPSEEKTLSVYPNPCKNILHLDISYQNAVLYDITGNIIGSFSNSATLDLSAVPQGMYTLLINTEKKQWTKKIIKE